MISIVTGTLDRLNFLPDLIENTVLKSDQIELILVDGGSTDGTIEYIKSLNHQKIKLIEIGGRSSYPHFMNIGIEHSSYEYICQWNDDVLLINTWDEIINELSSEFDFYIFNWKYGNKSDLNNEEWIIGTNHENKKNKGWCIVCDEDNVDHEIVMNYGIYNKKIFREIGMFYPEFKYYYADGDMATRSKIFGYKYKCLPKIKVCSLYTEKRAIDIGNGYGLYVKLQEEYKLKILNDKHIFLK